LALNIKFQIQIKLLTRIHYSKHKFASSSPGNKNIYTQVTKSD